MPTESIHDRVARRLGKLQLEPMTPIVAGENGQWALTLTVGSAGIDEGGTIKFAHRFASDFEHPQFDNPTKAGYTTISTTGPAKLRARYDRKAHDRPWMACIVVDVYDGSLSPGDKVTLVLGDRSKGSPGMRAQSFQETAHEFRVFVDPTNACVARSIADVPVVPIIAGKPVELICIVPTQAEIGKLVRILVKGQDKWGNPTPPPSGLVLSWKGQGKADISGDRLTFSAAGSGVICAAAGELRCQSNPITAFAAPPAIKKYWGDLHAQSDATVGTGTEEEYFAFARDVAALDFCSHQGNDFQMRPSDWQRLNDVIRRFHSDHHFVAFPGWEWSGNTSVGGDRNVWYLEEDLPMFRSSHWQVPDLPEDDQSPAETAADLFARARKSPRGKVLLGSHVGGRYADIRAFFDQDLGPLIELVSCWGIFEWMLWDAFDKGYIVGVVCNSDGHKGRPGAEGPGAGQFGIANGLTCVLAEEQTRASIFRALQNRRCYGTTGARIDLDFRIDGQLMGSVMAAKASHKLEWCVAGTAPLETVEVFVGKKVLQTWRPAAFASLKNSRQVRVSWRGSRIRGRGRRVNWDGRILVSGAKIVAATAHFDTPVDRITSQSASEVAFVSQTTGDTDWIDLILDDASHGTIKFDSKAGQCAVDLGELTDVSPSRSIDFGGLDMQVKVERYPQQLTEHQAGSSLEIHPPAGATTPYFVKVTQSDGHLAWCSPIYLRG